MAVGQKFPPIVHGHALVTPPPPCTGCESPPCLLRKIHMYTVIGVFYLANIFG